MSKRAHEDFKLLSPCEFDNSIFHMSYVCLPSDLLEHPLTWMKRHPRSFEVRLCRVSRTEGIHPQSVFTCFHISSRIFPPALSRQENFTTPRAVVSLRFFNCFRLLLEKAEDPNELKIYVETLAFKLLGREGIVGDGGSVLGLAEICAVGVT